MEDSEVLEAWRGGAECPVEVLGCDFVVAFFDELVGVGGVG